ncbi:MAG: C4-dicarboxylate ABC transporter substrate-binding protein [Dokdonella sp.]|nr:MAG: C4-dicarboxylate ABC transporter substrate-binding protein [Dokdonella sp.]
MKRLLSLLLSSGILFSHLAVSADADYKIVTASERGTYIRIGRDFAQFVAPAANISLQSVSSAGSVDNVRRLRYEPGVKFALVQSDVYQAFLDMAGSGNAEAGALIKPLRVIMPLYNEEIYFIVRADSERNFIHEIRNGRINAGEVGSGTALTSTTLYRLMFGEAIPEGKTTFLSNEEALVKLVTDKSIDVVAVVAGQPAKLLVDMTPEARQHIKLLKFDPGHSSSRSVLRTYFQATIRAANYPSLLTADLTGLAVKALLVTYDFQMKDTEGSLRRFARSLCQNFPTLQEKGHPKWREVDLALPDLGRSWTYYGPTSTELRACGGSSARPATAAVSTTPAAGKVCSQAERVLGLCK